MPQIHNDFLNLANKFRHHPSRWKRWAATVVGVVAITTSLFLGFFVILIATGLFTMVGIVIAIRIWWLQRLRRDEVKKADSDLRLRPTNRDAEHHGGRVIDGDSVDITDK